MRNTFQRNKNTALSPSVKSLEWLLDRISAYIILMLILLITGLLYSNGNSRGIPLPWLYAGTVDFPKLLLSSAVILVVIIAADAISGLGRLKEADYKRQYRAAKVIANRSVKPTEVISYAVDEDLTAGFQEEISDDSAAQAYFYGEDMYSYTDTAASDVDSSVTVADDYIPALASVDSVDSSKKSKKSSSSVVTVMLIILSIMVAVFACDGFSDTNWTDDDGEFDWETVDDTDEFHLTCDEFIEDCIIPGDIEGLCEIDSDEDKVNRFLDSVTWPEEADDLEYIDTFYNNDIDKAVVKYSFYTDDTNYIIAFRTVRNNSDYDPEEGEEVYPEFRVKGISVAPDIMYDRYEAYNFYPYDYEDEEWNEMIDLTKENAVSIGKDTFDGVPIILWDNYY